jgi:hypothetical protein
MFTFYSDFYGIYCTYLRIMRGIKENKGDKGKYEGSKFKYDIFDLL